MKGGYWHTVYEDDRYIAIWVSEEGDVPCARDDYLDGMFLHRFDAEALADDANLLIAGDIEDARLDALRRIVERLR